MILIPVKQVPDSWSEKELDANTKRLARGQSEPVLNDLDEFAIEAALQIAEAHSMRTAVVTVGPEGAREALLKALSMGVDEAYHVNDSHLEGACFHQTSSTIAAVAKKIGATLIITGLESTDGKGSVIPSMVAAYLDWASATALQKVTLDGSTISGIATDSRSELQFSIDLPCVISVSENANEPRFPSFKGIMAAKKKVITDLTLTDIQGQGFDEYLSSATIEVKDWIQSPPRSKGELVSDASAGIAVLSQILTESKES